MTGEAAPTRKRDRRRVATLAATARRVPFGILVVAALFAVGGAGATVAGAYLVVTRGDVLSGTGIAAAVVGPSVLYLAYHLFRLDRWAWTALLLLVVLLTASTVYRVIADPGALRLASAEFAGEFIAAVYLLRPAVRAKFRRRAS